jgi:O-acetyl-ADP-ribose deacetylase (regulator of RNase III)
MVLPMIEYTTGNLLEADTEALVNTVNTVGVMGKGIALQFKERFPENFKRYADVCKRKELVPGKLLVTTEHTLQGDRTIINFPTKTEWFRKSSYTYIEKGLVALAELIREQGIQSIALPPLGCGHGGLDWNKVRPMIAHHLGGLPVRVVVYEPSADVKAILQQEKPRDAKLTPARAMLLHALFDFEQQGERASLFVANKLAYFLQLLGEPLRLKFVAHHYGPYSVQVENVLYHLNGSYLRGLEQKNAKPFEELQLVHARRAEVEQFVATSLSAEQRTRLALLTELVHGFRASDALELLASVAYIRTTEARADADAIMARMNAWSDRKASMADADAVRVAREHLDAFGQRMSFA